MQREEIKNTILSWLVDAREPQTAAQVASNAGVDPSLTDELLNELWEEFSTLTSFALEGSTYFIFLLDPLENSVLAFLKGQRRLTSEATIVSRMRGDGHGEAKVKRAIRTLKKLYLIGESGGGFGNSLKFVYVPPVTYSAE